MVDSDPVVPERMSQVSKRSEVVYINGAPSTPGYLLALLRELSHVARDLTEIAEAKQVRKTNLSSILYQFKKRVRKSILTFRTQNLVDFFLEGFLAAKKIGDSPIKLDMKLGPQTHTGAESQSQGTIQLVPKP